MQTLFTADDGKNGLELWKTDGTAAGTVLVKDIRPGALGSDLSMYHSRHSALGGSIYFGADDGVHGNELWKTNGTAAGTVLVQDIDPGLAHGDPTMFRKSGSTLFFQACTIKAGCELYQLTGTTVTLVRDIQRGTGDGDPSHITSLGNGSVVFAANDGVTQSGAEPWISDGTKSGTRLLKDIWSGMASSKPTSFTRLSSTTSKVLFSRIATQPAQEKLVNPRSFEKQGKLAESIEAWKTWARLKPKDPLPYQEVLRLALLMNKPQVGIEFGEKGQEQFPKDLPLMMAMATAHMRLAELIAGGMPIDRDLRTALEEAEFQAESALAVSPRMRGALAVLGMAQFRLGRYEDARDTAKLLAKEHPKHHGGPFLVGEIAFRQYEIAKADPDADPKTLFLYLGEARQGFMEASRRDPKKARPFRRLGDVSWWQGDKAQCLKWYIEGLARDPREGAPTAWIDTELQKEQFKRMDIYTKAAEKFAELKTQPAKDRALLLQKAAAAACLASNWKLCKSLSEEAYRLDPSWKDALYYHAIACYKLDDYDGAAIAMGMYAIEAPERLDATLSGCTKQQGRDLSDKLVFLAGKAYRKGQQLPSRAMNRALAVYRDDAESWNNYAFLCRETRAYEDSYGAYQKALAKAPKDPRLLNDAAVILQYHLDRDLTKARKMYEEAILQGKRVLRDRSSSEARKKEARQAISDANGNLKVLKKAKAKKGRK